MSDLTNDQKANIARLAASGPVAVVEYRGEKGEIVEYIKKESGKKRYMVKHHVACELLETGEQLPCELYTPRLASPKDNEDQEKPELPPATGLKRGTRLILQISGYVLNQGVVSCRIKAYAHLDGPGSGVPIDPTSSAGPTRDYKLGGTPAPAKS